MGFNIGSKIITATGGSIHRVGNYRVHQFPPQHVTDGLALFVDFGNDKSWNGHSYSVNDLSPFKQTPVSGTLSGVSNQTEITHQGQGRSMIFDRSFNAGHRVAFSGPLKGFRSDGLNKCTFEAWAMATTNQAWNSVIYHIGSNRGIGFHTNGNVFVGGNGGGGAHHYFDSSGITAGTWTHIVGVYENNDIINSDYGSARLYVNGVLTSGATPVDVGDNGSTTNGELRIGQWATGNNNEMLTGRIAIVRLYNRALSADEVVQNYNAEKVRFTTYTENFSPTFTGNRGKLDCLVVGGGGGGGSKSRGSGGGGTAAGAGGGAGGLLYRTGFEITADTTVRVGAGGTGGGTLANGAPQNDDNGTQGGNTVFSTLTAYGGGYGGGNGGAGQGGNGTVGSGGGAGNVDSSGTVPTTGQGNRGGRAAPHDNASGRTYPRGGGGGAGDHGGDGGYTSDGTNAYASGVSAGNGGSGLPFDITGETKFYAGGGGAASFGNGAQGKGGSGVGGDATISQNSFSGNAVPDTGSGGGGGRGGSVNDQGGGGAGSNGTVILRYPAEDYNAEVLIVAGGGGGGGDRGGGGGGAGGVLYFEKFQIVSGKNYKVTVGRGGYGGAGDSTAPGAQNGYDSVFGNHIAVGGGAGGVSGYDPTSGGSGGGCRHNSAGNSNGVPGRGIEGQGHAGGGSAAGHQGSGGGGAGGPGIGALVGTQQSYWNTGDGGPGREISITGTATYYGGGGAGGGNESGRNADGGIGGGGGSKYGNNTTGDAGTANTGGGGGGGGVGSGSYGGAGGSGIIIIAYKGPQRGISAGATIDTTSRPGFTLHKFTSTGYFRFVG